MILTSTVYSRLPVVNNETFFSDFNWVDVHVLINVNLFNNTYQLMDPLVP